MSGTEDADAVLVFGDQLTDRTGPVAADANLPVVMIEAHAMGERLPYHPHRLALVWSGMRHFRERLESAGREVMYIKCEEYEDGINQLIEDTDYTDLIAMRPLRHGMASQRKQQIEDAGGSLQFVEDSRFLISPEQFDEWMGDPPYRHEQFYRKVRSTTGYLMDGEDPIGEEWNYDEENRDTPPAGYRPPDPPAFDPDAITESVLEMINQRFDGGYGSPPYGGSWADPESFTWPVTRKQALTALERFVEDRLPEFGPYQDAMVADEPLMNHSLLSTSLHLGLLHPAEVTEAAIDAYHRDQAPLNSVEGFVRQVIGWREFVRHVYRRGMPELAGANQLEATEPLPEWFWTGETDMACLSDVIEGVRTRGYAHHIERLMVLANFVSLAGINPAAFNRWFEAAFVDGFHWAATPNVVGMGTYGSDIMSSKPYVSSANYIDKMSDYCGDCPYNNNATIGEDACPFNTLYWDFLDRHEDQLRSNHRMGLVYGHLDRKSDEEKDKIRAQAATLRDSFSNR